MLENHSVCVLYGRYESKGQLRAKLLQALPTEGFGFA